MLLRQAYQIVHDELMLDGNSRLNLATFVTTWIEPEARELMSETFDNNMIDKDEYPQTARDRAALRFGLVAPGVAGRSGKTGRVCPRNSSSTLIIWAATCRPLR